MKKCTECGETKDLGGFYRNKNNKDSLFGQCKACVNERNKEWVANNKEQMIEYKKEYNKKWRGNNPEYHKEWRAKNPYRYTERRREYDKKYNVENKKRRHAAKKAWCANNRERVLDNNQKRRAKIKGLPHSLTAEEWQETLRACNYKCVYCGKSWEVREHFVPVLNGGGWTVDNILPACKQCNLSKTTKHPLKSFVRSLPLPQKILGQI